MGAHCSQMLFALRTLRSHGLSDSTIHVVYPATIISKLSYASPSWWRFTTAVDRERIEAFINRSVGQGYRSAASQTFADICSAADNRLFAKVTNSQTIAVIYYTVCSRQRERNIISSELGR